MPTPIRPKPSPIASTGIDQRSQGHPVPSNLDRRGHHGRRTPSVPITACEAVPHETQDIKREDRPTAEPIDVIRRAPNASAVAGSGNDSPAEASVTGHQAGRQEAPDLRIRIETATNNETGGNERASSAVKPRRRSSVTRRTSTVACSGLGDKDTRPERHAKPPKRRSPPPWPKPEKPSRSPARGWRTSSESRSTRQEERQWRSEQATRP